MPSEGGPSRNRTFAVIALAIAAVALLWLGQRDRVQLPASSTPGDAGVAPVQGPGPTSGPTGPAVAPAPSTSSPQGPTEAEVQAFRKWRVETLKEAAKYPGYSKPLTPRHYDALTRVEPQVTDYLENGHLILEAKVEVTKAGRYHLQGGLVGAGGESAVWSQVATVIDQPGTHTMKLKFFGLAFLAADVPGPYTLKFVSIAETGVHPVVQGTVMENAYTTKAYKLADFSAEPNKDPAMDEIIGQAESLTKAPVSGAVASGGPKDPKPEKPKPPSEPPPGHDPSAEPK